MEPVLDFANTNALWCSVLVETLARLGLRHAVLSPGSRSTPLTFAFAGHPRIASLPALDERSAGFFALGIARRIHQPVAVVCTSGTAAANLLPAVIEAAESGVPLLVLTADRPPELRDCRSGQTIDQVKLFGHYPVWQAELAVPEPEEALLAYVRQTAAHAWRRALVSGGPVHLNCPFRDPLAPLPDGRMERIAREFPRQAFFAAEGDGARVRQAADPGAEDLVRRLATEPRGVIVAGSAQPEDPAAYARAVAAIARRLGWPVLADGLSPLRNYAESAGAPVTAYDALLRPAALAERLSPRRVLVLDELPTSKELRRHLVAANPELHYINARGRNPDPLHGRAVVHECTPEQFAAGLAAGETAVPTAFARLWQSADARARASLDAALAAEAGFFEGKASWLMTEHLPGGTPVFVANSMPVRDVEFFWRPNPRLHSVHFNRGANGIDGTLSTALGMAHVAGCPAVLLTGDLALLHDSNGFLHRPHFRGSLTIVLINNDGGGIFEMLPVAGFPSFFEKFVATPQKVDFARLASAHGIEHHLIGSWAEYASALAVLPSDGIRILELRTDRKRDAERRRNLLLAAARAAE